MLFNLSKGAITARSFQYSGNSDFKRSGTDFMIVLEDSNANGSTFRLLKTIAHADICLVAGGKASPDEYGGDGGQVITATDIYLPAGTYTVTVGESGLDTVFTAPDGRSWTAQSGAGAAHGTPGADGVLAWNDPDTLLRPGWVYGSGGGRAYVRDNSYRNYDWYPGGSIGTAGDGDDTPWGQGGTSSHRDGYHGCPGTGQGGGGGVRYWADTYYIDYDGGAGGRGAVLIRKHKEAGA